LRGRDAGLWRRNFVDLSLLRRRDLLLLDHRAGEKRVLRRTDASQVGACIACSARAPDLRRE
jgi:hypothetical protein